MALQPRFAHNSHTVLDGEQKAGSSMRGRFLRHLIAIAMTVALVSFGVYFGVIDEAPPLIAPGIVP
jgi:hypothetical protein